MKKTLLQPDSVAMLLICSMLAAGALLSFPLYDDAWLVMMVRESGQHAIAQTMPDRPVLAFLIQRWVDLVGLNVIASVVMNAVLWLVFAIESAILFEKFFPEFKDYSALAACLALSPIVVQTQLCTVQAVLPCSLPAILSYAALLILLRDTYANKPTRPLLLGVAAALALIGVAISEYGVAANLAGVAVLAGVALAGVTPAVRRCLLISASWLFALTLSGYVLFTKTADFGNRPSVAPGIKVHSSLTKWMEVPFDVVSGTWRATIAAYARALGTIIIEWDSKSTLVGVLFASLIAGLLWYGIRKRHAKTEANDTPSQVTNRLAILLLAIFVGLLPVRLMGRQTILDDFGSRFLIPIMPVAASLTAALALRLVGKPLRSVAVATLGLIIGYATWMFTYTAIQLHRDIASAGTVLESYVTKTDGYTVAVMPFDRFESELTATIASAWPVELEKRIWVTGPKNAETEFGDRATCHPSAELNEQNRKLVRIGKLDELLWVGVAPGKPVSIQPYCLSAN